jgi:hypothetical protein
MLRKKRPDPKNRVNFYKICDTCESKYLKRFEDLTTKIKAKSIKADDNLLFLETLYELCKKL